jgi:hypothetical protein
MEPRLASATTRSNTDRSKALTVNSLFSNSVVVRKSHTGKRTRTTNRQPRLDPCPTILIIIDQAQFAVCCRLTTSAIARISHPENLAGSSIFARARSFNLPHKLNQPFIHSASSIIENDGGEKGAQNDNHRRLLTPFSSA